MKVNKNIVYALGISIALHIIFLIIFLTIKVVDIYSKAHEQQTVKVKMVDKEITIPDAVREGRPAQSPTPKFDQPPNADSISSFFDRKDQEIKKDKLIRDIEKVAQPLISADPHDLIPLPETKNGEFIPVEKIERKTRKDMVETPLVQSQSLLASPKGLQDRDGLPDDFMTQKPDLGFAQSASPGLFNNASQYSNTFLSGIQGAGANGNVLPKGELKDYLTYELFTYQDPEDGQKYFKISIKVQEKTNSLPTIPKEIVFLLDASLSIKQERLDQLKKGLEYCVNHLNQGDYFNIIVFKEETTKFSPKSLSPAQSDMLAAVGFVDRLKAGGKTDAYNALYKSINLENPMRPSYILFLSDGRPTKGITDSREVINEISRLNNGRTSIFAFSGGFDYNRYLLDFITFKNRGWSEYSDREFVMSKKMSSLYDEIKDPVLLNLRYHASGIKDEEIFPKVLPDFFRGADFTLYGKYTDENRFLLQLLGDLQGETKEYVLEASLIDAPAGDREIARIWAFNKIYSLISQLEYAKENTDVIKEISALCNKFNIQTPYSREIKK